MLRSTTGSGSRSGGVDGDVGEVVEGGAGLGAVGAGDAGGVGAAAGGVVVGGSLGWAPVGGVGSRRVDVGLLDTVGFGRRPNP